MLKRKPTFLPLPIECLVRGAYQPRRHFDPEKLRELADSIMSMGGLLQPIVVRPLADGKYEIIAGERRWRAAQLANLTEVNCLSHPYTDEQALQAAIMENVNRADLNPIEEAQGYQRMIDEFHYLHEEVAAAVGKSRVAVTNALRLLKLHPKVQALLIEQTLTEGHGKILASLSEDRQLMLAEQCIQKNWNVRKLEAEAKKLQQPADTNPYGDANLKHLEVALSEYMGNRTEVDYQEKGGGSVRIRFNNVDELEGLFARVGFRYKSE